jgi:hypothetical protein
LLNMALYEIHCRAVAVRTDGCDLGR